MFRTAVLLILSCFINNLFSQSNTLIGTITDSDQTPIELASVVLLNPKDSTVVTYSITDSKGFFQLTASKRETLLFQASSLGFKPFYKKIYLQSKHIDLKTIVLQDDVSTLDAVMISAVVPIQIKKDTIAFNTNSFKVNHDDTIEKLLGKLPGVEIDSDGKVVAQGEEVQRIFVNGKEFFGGDPAIVLKNLSADAISKVEVIDKKSDETELTGIDDGNKEVIINFTLKKNRQNQGFGKLSGGIGSDKRYFGNVNFNQFNPKTQVSVIGKFNNINITGSNIKGFLENASGLDDESSEESMTATKPKSFSGFLTTGVTGVHYGHEFKKKESVNADYFFNHTNNYGLSNTNRLTFSNTSNFDFKALNDFNNTSNNHNLNFNYENKSNSKYSLKITGGLIADMRDNFIDSKGKYFNEDGNLATTNDYILNTKNDRSTGRINTQFYRRLQKKGRSFNAGISANISDRSYFNTQKSIRTSNIGSPNEREREQFTLRDEYFKTDKINLLFTYTEPLIVKHFLKISGTAVHILDQEHAKQLRTDITRDNEETFSYNFFHNERRYSTKFLHNYVSKKWFLSYGAEIQDINRTFGENNHKDIVRNQYYTNPLAMLQYKPKRGIKYRLNYQRQIKSPRTPQITTVVNDLNPYNIRTGNPNLKNEKLDVLTFNTNIHDFKSALSFYANIQYRCIQNTIISNVTIDDDFVRTRTYDNAGDTQNLKANLSLSKKINKLNIRYTLKNKTLFSTSKALVNLKLNDVETQDYWFSFQLENSNKSILDIKAGASLSLNHTNFSLDDDLDRKYTKQQYFASFDCQVSNKLNFNTQFDYITFTDNTFTEIQKLPLLNAAVSYAFSKNNNILKLVLIDIFNKNVDIYRRSTVNYFEETVTESLGRYAILSYSYRLNNNKRRK
ncbi:outer membrane beta-barrel protein [Tamlana fucoidanivorans]|uniref:Outer membrane protein beta-barrel domain-containing protein n=1 Tax=Allotamlana fucoidanivorans TaxID=2583814 RepID=A0A5C4SJ83_9FLAO|nr:outer membrane beta-barrel protein [Tamlana fucoidanivorans]TNJ43714.1 hypothetical protein FGF67_10090 [Tamlana fucoidanivorans]